jgi:hypothetical protein
MHQHHDPDDFHDQDLDPYAEEDPEAFGTPSTRAAACRSAP